MKTIKEIRKDIQSKYAIHYFGRFQQWFAPYSLWLLLRTSITPNQVTFFMILFGLACSPLLLFNNYYLYLVFIPVYLFYQQLDAIDGALARYKKMFSNKGIYLDFISHLVVEPMMFFSLGLGRFLATGDLVLLILGVSMMFSQMILRSVNSLVITTQYKGKTLKPSDKIYNEQPKWNKMSFLMKIKFFITKIFFLPYLIVIFIGFLLFNKPDYFLYAYGFTMPLIAVLNLYLGSKKVGQ